MNQTNFIEFPVTTNFLNLAKDICSIFADEIPEYREFLTKSANIMEISKIEFSGVGFYLNIKKSIFSDKKIENNYITAGNKLLKFNSLDSEFDFIIFCKNGSIDLIEIVSFSAIDNWDGKFSSYKFI